MTTIELSEEERAYQRVLRMLSASEQSSRKVRAKLERAGYSDELIERTIERARDHGILDDARYAEMLVRSALSQNKGMRAVSAELDELGIALEEVEAYREQRMRERQDASGGEVMRARMLLESRPPRAKNIRDAAFRRLMSKGYDADIAAEVAQWWADQHAR